MRFQGITLAFGLALAAFGANAQSVTGAGSTFAAPVYGKWGEAAKAATGVSLNYQAIGSGAGQTQVFNRTVDFGASDAPVASDKLQANHLLQIPTVMGAVDVVVNLPGVSANALRLTGDVLADIYQGKISKWNDPRIVALNAEITLPNMPIAPVYRADGSGTTFVFTDYLSMVSPAWKDRVGANTSVRWPAGSGARGSDGVAATVRNIRGGIGYVESAYATQNKLITVQLRNKDGAWVSPNVQSFAAAAANADWAEAKNFAVDLNNEPGATSWPIMSATFVLLPLDPKDPAQHNAVVKFFTWGLQQGDSIAQGLGYITLTASVKAKVIAAMNGQQ